VATATVEAEEDWEEDWEAGTAKEAGTERVAEKAGETLVFSVRSVESGFCGKRILKIFQGLPKEDFKRFQADGKERDKKEDTKRHYTRRKSHTETVYTHS